MPFKKGDPNINRGGRKAGTASYRSMIQEAFVDIMSSKMQVGKQSVPYYQAFLENLKIAALKPDSKAFTFMAERLLAENVLDDIDRQLNKSKREDRDFLAYRVLKDCHDFQQKVLLSKDRYIYLMAGRRAGKSEADVKKAVSTAIDREDARILLIGLSFTRCIEVFWQPIVQLLGDLGIEVLSHNRSEGTLKLNNNSEIHFHGNTTVDERDKIRGSKWDVVIIDEVQNQKALPILINEIIEPTLLDRKGQLILSGTGPKVRGTYWEELWTNNVNALKLNWNISHNPFIPDYEKVLEDIKRDKGLSDTSPLFLREYLGKISYDDDALVFRLTPDNYYNTENEITQWINSQPVTDVKFSAGLDYGWSDADGFVITMFSTSKPEKWILWEHKSNRTGITELADKIKEGIAYINTNPIFQCIPDRHFYIYSDAGGVGKKVSYELSTQYGLPCLDAYKVDKDFQIEMLQEEVRTGHLKVRENGPFAAEALKTVFARNEKDELTRLIDDDVFHPDLCDAMRYSLSLVWINYKNT